MTELPTHDPPVTEPQWSLELFGAWRLSRDDAVHTMRTREQRLIALLALQGRRRRSYLAGILWPESTEARASANLRAAIFRSEHIAPGLLLHRGSDVALTPNLRIDVRDFVEYVWRLSTVRQAVTDADADARTCLRLLQPGDLLPGWYDDWVIYERERIRQRLLHGLEAVCRQLLRQHRPADAIEAAMEAVRIEPLRESSQQLLIEAHLAEHNYGEARRTLHSFEQLLEHELGIRPNPDLISLISTAAVTSL
jgi:DNA-binding SARP family transcriptional activator